MTKRTNAAKQLADYFKEKGHILSAFEYKKVTDGPIRYSTIIKTFGSWNRMENIVRGGNPNRDEELVPDTDAAEVIQRNATVEAEYLKKMKAASEDLHAKTAREAAAKAYIEADKMRAKTAEGAAENKKRKGGFTSQDAKAQKEAVEQAVAEEHAMLAKSGAGSALGKHLLGGVENNDEKTAAIEAQIAMRTKTKLMAATPEGAAEAKLMEDDTDGQLTREAETRIRGEQRTYVPPVTQGTADQAEKIGTGKVREEVRKIVTEAKGDENVMTDAVWRASIARGRANQKLNDPVSVTDIPSELVKTMPPAHRPADDDFASDTSQLKNKDGKVVGTFDKPEDQKETDGGTLGDSDASVHLDRRLGGANVETKTDSAKESKMSPAQEKANEKNPATPPATRNPDPEIAPLANPNAGDEQQGNEGAAKPAEVTPAAKK